LEIRKQQPKAEALVSHPSSLHADPMMYAMGGGIMLVIVFAVFIAQRRGRQHKHRTVEDKPLVDLPHV
ncbi:hypothetical protein PENTCL1PPCAC_20654, partial [Pristionchus entomophagus]